LLTLGKNTTGHCLLMLVHSALLTITTFDFWI